MSRRSRLRNLLHGALLSVVVTASVGGLVSGAAAQGDPAPTSPPATPGGSTLAVAAAGSVSALDGAHGWVAWTVRGTPSAGGVRSDVLVMRSGGGIERSLPMEGQRLDDLRVVRVRPRGGQLMSRVLVRACDDLKAGCRALAVDPASGRITRPAWAERALAWGADGRHLLRVDPPLRRGRSASWQPERYCPRLSIRTLEGKLVRRLPAQPMQNTRFSDPDDLRDGCGAIRQSALLGDRVVIRQGYVGRELDEVLLTWRAGKGSGRWALSRSCTSFELALEQQDATDFALDRSGITCRESNRGDALVRLSTGFAFGHASIDRLWNSYIGATSKTVRLRAGELTTAALPASERRPCDIASDGVRLTVLRSDRCAFGVKLVPAGQDVVEQLPSPVWKSVR